jgi:hypothetical protein
MAILSKAPKIQLDHRERERERERDKERRERDKERRERELFIRVFFILSLPNRVTPFTNGSTPRGRPF